MLLSKTLLFTLLSYCASTRIHGKSQNTGAVAVRSSFVKNDQVRKKNRHPSQVLSLVNQKSEWALSQCCDYSYTMQTTSTKCDLCSALRIIALHRSTAVDANNKKSGIGNGNSFDPLRGAGFLVAAWIHPRRKACMCHLCYCRPWRSDTDAVQISCFATAMASS